MYPFFNRIGSKRSIKEKVYSLFPKEYDIYVEPFIGSGALYFYKEPSKKEIINDLDKQLIEGYKLLKKADTNETHYQILDTIPSIQRFVDKKATNNNERLLQLMYIHNNTFSSSGKGKIYKEYGGQYKINNLEEYKERLKKTTILNQNYKKVIEKYDSDKTFFYLDPPYENPSTDLYNHDNFDFIELNEVLRNLKGKFLLSINDSKNIRTIFKGFKIRPFLVKSSGSNTNIGEKDRKELFISNY
jgi:DNA adenine methylase